jgi:hypothetical protein
MVTIAPGIVATARALAAVAVNDRLQRDMVLLSAVLLSAVLLSAVLLDMVTTPYEPSGSGASQRFLRSASG